jgi:hypothetical protein
MADLSGFDANEIEPTSDFEPIPAGKYLAVVSGSEMKATKAGTGEYLELKFQVLAGPHRNRLLWARLNLQNPNPTAIQIAKAELSALCRAVGVLAPSESEELHNLPLIIRVCCKRREDTGEITNEIKGYSPKDEPGEKLPAAPADNSTPPWQRTPKAAG